MVNNTTGTQNDESLPGLRPEPNQLGNESPIQLDHLRRLTNQSVVSSRQFDRDLIVEICRFAALLEQHEVASYHPLDGKIAITAFFEASTRTRLSFESAVLRLDGKVLSVPDGKNTGVAKGESMQDIGEMFNAYGDAVIMRHTRTEAVEELLENLRVPLINAGNGTGEHPTQALADWFALLKWRPELAQDLAPAKKVHLGIIGTPASMRAVRSFLTMTLQFNCSIGELTFVSEMADPLGEDLTELVIKSGIPYRVVNNLNDVVDMLDILYINSITYLGDTYKQLDKRFKLTPGSELKNEAVILHPLARNDELSPKLDDTPHNLYFSQAAGAVYIRQALLITVLDRFDRLPQSINPESRGRSSI